MSSPVSYQQTAFIPAFTYANRMALRSVPVPERISSLRMSNANMICCKKSTINALERKGQFGGGELFTFHAPLYSTCICELFDLSYIWKAVLIIEILINTESIQMPEKRDKKAKNKFILLEQLTMSCGSCGKPVVTRGHVWFQ